MSHRVLIADDHPLMRAALRQAVTQVLDDAEVVDASRFDQIPSLLDASDSTDIILLDLHMPGMSGFIGLMMLRAEHPAIPVIVVSASEDPATIQRTIDYGASGFVPKSAPITDVGRAIRAVLDGEIWVPDIDLHHESGEGAMAQRIVNLTPQQLRVLAGIAEGKLNKQIAYEMNVTEATVKAHVTTILRKLGVVNRTQAILVASQLALTQPPSPE